MWECVWGGWGGVLEHSFKTTVHDHFQKAAEAKLSAGETNTHIAMPSAQPHKKWSACYRPRALSLS